MLAHSCQSLFWRPSKNVKQTCAANLTCTGWQWFCHYLIQSVSWQTDILKVWQRQIYVAVAQDLSACPWLGLWRGYFRSYRQVKLPLHTECSETAFSALKVVGPVMDAHKEVTSLKKVFTVIVLFSHKHSNRQK